MAANKGLIFIVTAVACILLTVPAFSEDNTGGVLTNGVKTQEEDNLSLQQLKQEMDRLNEKIQSMQEENDIRQQLEVTEEEKYDTESEILSAAGRDYTMLKKGLLGFEYSFTYAGYAYNVLISDPTTIEYASDHSLTNSFHIEYPLENNLTLSTNIPFVYKIDTQSDASNMYVTDLGDTSFSLQFQPYKSGGEIPTAILSAGLNCPTGRSPYKIDPDAELSTGSGAYSISSGVNLSKTVDPLVLFGGLSFTYPFEITGLKYKRSSSDGEKEIWMESVEPGPSISYSMGVGYSLSYMVSVNLSFQYGYSFKTTYHWNNRATYDSGDSSSASLGFGTGWRITPERTVNVSVNMGLSSNAPDYTLTVRVPFEFEL